MKKYIVELWLPARHLVQCRLTEERRWCNCDKAVKGFVMLYIEGCYMYMGSHVLMNLLNESRKSDKMLGLPSTLSLFTQLI